VASLEYAIGLLHESRDQARRTELDATIEGLRAEVEASGSAQMTDALAEATPFGAASRLLVAAQNEPGATADVIRNTLHPVLFRQLDEEMAAGGWMIMDADPSDVLTADAAALWPAVLGRQPDPALRRLALYPADINAN